MIAIAGGIILVLLILCLLPYIVLTLSAVFTVALAIAIVFGAGLLLWAGYQTPRGLAVELAIGGAFLLWLVFEIKARRQAAEDTERSAE